jgi:hypothetical protein
MWIIISLAGAPRRKLTLRSPHPTQDKTANVNAELNYPMRKVFAFRFGLPMFEIYEKPVQRKKEITQNMPRNTIHSFTTSKPRTTLIIVAGGVMTQ